MRRHVVQRLGSAPAEDWTGDLSTAVTLSSGLAGGILTGGVLMAVATVRVDLRPGAILLFMTVLYAFGASMGLLFGALLGVVGRDETEPRSVAVQRVRWALLKSIPLLLAGWLVAATIALTGDVLQSGPWPLLLVVAASWGVAAVVVLWGVAAGTRALWNTLGR